MNNYTTIQNILYLLKRTFKFRKESFFAIILCIFVGISLSYANSYLPKFIIDNFGQKSSKVFIITSSLIAVLLIFIFNILKEALDSYLKLIGKEQISIYNEECNNRKISMNYEKYIKKSTKDYIESFDEMLNGPRSIVSVFPVNFAKFLTSLMGICFFGNILFNVDLKLIICITLLLMFSLFYDYYTHSTKRKLRLESKAIERKVNYSIGLFSKLDYINEIKLNNNKKWLVNKYKSELIKYINHTKKIKKIDLIGNLFSVILNNSSQFISYIVLLNMIINKYIQISEAVLYINIINKYLNWIQDLFYEIIELNRKNDIINLYRKFISEPDYSREYEKIKIKEVTSIEFRNVYYKYSNSDKYALQNVSFMIKFINKNNDLECSAIELLSIFYKYLEKELQTKIFDLFLKIIRNKQKSNRLYVAATMFIKNAFRAFDNKQMEIVEKYLKASLNVCDEEAQDTIKYTLMIIKTAFVPQSDIVFVIPEFQTGTSFLQPPLGLINAKTLLKQRGIIVDILDNRIYSHSILQLCNILSNYSTVVVCSSPIDQCNTYFLDYRYALFCATINMYKSLYENPVVVCGAHGTVKPDFVMRDCKADVVIKGEYDIQLFDFIMAKDENINKLANLVIRNGEKYYNTQTDLKLSHSDKWAKIEPDYNEIDLKYYFGYKYVGTCHLKKLNWSIVQTNRGCPYNCSFCHNFYGKKVRFRSIESVILELKNLEKKDIEEVFFLDQTFTLNRDYTIKLCQEMISHNIKIKWYCQTRVDFFDKELAILLKKSGCLCVWFGIESVNQDVLLTNNKMYTKDQLLNVINILHEINLEYNAFIMLGMMGETIESMKETIDFIKKNKVRLTKSIMVCTPRFGATMLDYAEKQLGHHIESFFELDAYRGNINNYVNEEDIKWGIGELIKNAN